MVGNKFTRRRALRTIGAGLIGTPMLSGSGSAHCLDVPTPGQEYQQASSTPSFTPRWEFDTFTIDDAVEGWASSQTRSLPEWSQTSGLSFDQEGDTMSDRVTIQLDKRYSNVWGSVSQIGVIATPVYIDLEEFSAGTATVSVDIESSHSGAVELSGSPGDSTQISVRGSLGLGPYTDVRQQTNAPELSRSLASLDTVEQPLFDRWISGGDQRQLIENAPSVSTITTEISQSDTYVVYGRLESVAKIQYENDTAKIDFGPGQPDLLDSSLASQEQPPGLTLEQIRIQAKERR